jgi:uncharacterized protein (TIGR03435 family)
MREITCIVMVLLARAAAQTPDTTLQFEVASIKLAIPDPRGMRVSSRGGPGTDDPGLFTCENCELSGLVMRAYLIQNYQFSGPDWMGSTRFIISAKIPDGTTKEQFQLMLQNLLAERFKLTFHREKKETQTYDLVIAKNGPKMKESVQTPPSSDDPPAPNLSGQPKKDESGFPILPPGRQAMMMGIQGGYATQRFTEESMAQFAGMLASRVLHPVTDATGLKGKYDFTLRWIMDGGGPSTDDPGPSLVQAISEQLGLKLESKKGMIETLVVDHAEKTPIEN